jgi:hypothetical protein
MAAGNVCPLATKDKNTADGSTWSTALVTSFSSHDQVEKARVIARIMRPLCIQFDNRLSNLEERNGVFFMVGLFTYNFLKMVTTDPVCKDTYCNIRRIT